MACEKFATGDNDKFLVFGYERENPIYIQSGRVGGWGEGNYASFHNHLKVFVAVIIYYLSNPRYGQ